MAARREHAAHVGKEGGREQVEGVGGVLGTWERVRVRVRVKVRVKVRVRVRAVVDGGHWRCRRHPSSPPAARGS